MIRPYEFAVAFRYLSSRNKNRFISFISLISIMGIAIAVAVLIIVMSVMNGFEYEVRNKILQVVSHGAISGWEGRLEDWRLVEDIALAHPQVTSVARYIGAQGMLVGEDSIKGIEVRGVDAAAELATSGIGELITQGSLESLQPGAYRIVIGSELAELLGASLGDALILMTSDGVTTPAGVVPRMRHFEVSGIFYAGMYEFDRNLALIDVTDAGRLFRMGEDVSGVRISVKDVMTAPGVIRGIAQSLGFDVYVTDWTRQHANFFRSIQLTKSIIFMFQLLVVAVAAFNIISTLVMVVREKRAEIAILRTLGAPPFALLRIFMVQGTLVGVVGTVLGVLLGVVVSVNLASIVAVIEKVLGFRFLEPDIYFISDFPSRILGGDVLQVALIALVLAFLSTIYPAWRAAGTEPAEALRHE
jgi:lipoprotein-releasing system permease protein